MATRSSECLRPDLLKTSTLPLHSRDVHIHWTYQNNSKPWRPNCGSDLALFHQGMETGVLWCHLVVGDWSFGSWGLQGGTSLDQTCSGSAHRHLIWWDLENLESRLMLFITFLEPFLGGFCSEAEHTVLLGGPLPSGIVYTVFEWVMVCVKY